MLDDPENYRWLEGLAEFEVVFMELIPGQKRTRCPWDRFDQMHRRNGGSCLQSAQGWLQRGSGVAYRPANDLWCLDVDTPIEVERVANILADAWIFPPWQETPSGGAHFLFRFPQDFPRFGLKHHVCHPIDADGSIVNLDFKFGNRTMLIAPGTARAGRYYTPKTKWSTPPAVNPEMFLVGGQFWKEPTPFLIDQRPMRDRVIRAGQYLKLRAPISICGKGGRKALGSVASHLVAFLRLDPGLACSLLTGGENPWNLRCRDGHGQPFPWSQRELLDACCDAVDSVPGAGRRVVYKDFCKSGLRAR